MQASVGMHEALLDVVRSFRGTPRLVCCGVARTPGQMALLWHGESIQSGSRSPIDIVDDVKSSGSIPCIYMHFMLRCHAGYALWLLHFVAFYLYIMLVSPIANLGLWLWLSTCKTFV